MRSRTRHILLLWILALVVVACAKERKKTSLDSGAADVTVTSPESNSGEGIGTEATNPEIKQESTQAAEEQGDISFRIAEILSADGDFNENDARLTGCLQGRALPVDLTDKIVAGYAVDVFTGSFQERQKVLLDDKDETESPLVRLIYLKEVDGNYASITARNPNGIYCVVVKDTTLTFLQIDRYCAADFVLQASGSTIAHVIGTELFGEEACPKDKESRVVVEEAPEVEPYDLVAALAEDGEVSEEDSLLSQCLSEAPPQVIPSRGQLLGYQASRFAGNDFSHAPLLEDIRSLGKPRIVLVDVKENTISHSRLVLDDPHAYYCLNFEGNDFASLTITRNCATQVHFLGDALSETTNLIQPQDCPLEIP